jgi:hypothetical protein
MPQPSNPFPSDSVLYPIVDTLLSRPTPPLVPRAPWNAELAKTIDAAAKAEKASVFVTAALHLLNDDLHSTHTLVQAYEGNQTADYLHMLVHRREGDWSNTGYWVRRTGEHPAYATLALLSDGKRWDASAMVDLCRQANQGKPNPETAESISQLSAQEIAAALTWCVRYDASKAASAR